MVFISGKAMAYLNADVSAAMETFSSKPVQKAGGYEGAIISTSLGNIEIKFLIGVATSTVKNFVTLADQGFYNDTNFHRVINNFMIQAGDPLSRGAERGLYGTGGPGYKFADEINDTPMVRGKVAMANSGPNTNGSQFFIITAAQTPWLQGKHTVFATVVNGMKIADNISLVPRDSNDVPIEPVIIKSVTLVK